MYYYTCPKCGSNLDPGEKCDCEINERELKKTHPENGCAGIKPDKNIILKILLL